MADSIPAIAQRFTSRHDIRRTHADISLARGVRMGPRAFPPGSPMPSQPAAPGNPPPPPVKMPAVYRHAQR
ncbi:hypothetical protein [Paracoccus laeviglucosivorans]|uniref:Uncharacterized protein n=1 Tax=Paracoccus laeviglucosivorans TaxID=1197861 RepID=A0A521ESV7_9RHOB|nr:hypothetical protein [Paracoccus laeviglucosivorans]SMO86962.1 hypothetical protein SAMN06265221_11551 [Paracoccus laeviglucosivorans]